MKRRVKRRVIVLIVVLLLVAPWVVSEARSATTPTSFATQVTLSYMYYMNSDYSHAPYTKVMCAKGKGEWVRMVANHYSNKDADYINGFVRYNGRTAVIRLAPWVCWHLMRGPTQPAYGDPFDFGAALYVITHEATHALGYRDEAQTSCIAIKLGPDYVLKTFWPDYTHLSAKITKQAIRYYKIQPSSYIRRCQ